MGKPTFDDRNAEVVPQGAPSGFRSSQEGMKLPNKIGGFKRTQGTETSQYLEERTSTETPLVVASERGLGQCHACKNRNRMESLATVGDSPLRVESMHEFE